MANCVALIFCGFMHILLTVWEDRNNTFFSSEFLLKIGHWGKLSPHHPG